MTQATATDAPPMTDQAQVEAMLLAAGIPFQLTPTRSSGRRQPVLPEGAVSLVIAADDNPVSGGFRAAITEFIFGPDGRLLAVLAHL